MAISLLKQALKRALSVEKASSTPGQQMVGTLPRGKVYEIARTKMSDLNAGDIEAAARIIEGTARSMGISVE